VDDRAINVLVSRYSSKTEEGQRNPAAEQLEVAEESWRRLSPNGPKRRLLQVNSPPPRQEPDMPENTVGHDPELLTISEAAELLRTPVATLRYWRHLGAGPASFRLGRRVLYRRDDLHAWVDAQHRRDAGRRA
jgi:excisionase family DNA binding protein